MDVYEIADKFVKGELEAAAGLSVHDAVHVLGTFYQVSKPDLRAAIYEAYKPVIEELDPADDMDIWMSPAVEGDDA